MVLRNAVIASLVLLLGSAFLIAFEPIPPHHFKRVQRALRKTFDKTAVVDQSQYIYDSTKMGEGYAIKIYSADCMLGTLHYRKANACNFGGCVDTACSTANVGFKEHIYYYLLMDNNQFIKRIGILEYESQYGYEITSRAWLKQFYGKKSGDFKVNENVNGITGATISVNAMVNDINGLSVREEIGE